MKIAIVTILFLFSWAEASFSQVAVIAHKSVPVDTIKKSELLDFYTADVKKWINGEKVIVNDLKPKGEVKKIFYKFLGKTPSRMKSIWLRNMLSGEGDPPEALKSEEEMLQKIAATPGAIGFLSHTKVDNNVKTLIVIKKK
ncbi:hypothetical protein IH785_11635 [candidate division KSB1 bacterium]|nr:hypothetical protein [candidate division KSB1 bacterium]